VIFLSQIFIKFYLRLDRAGRLNFLFPWLAPWRMLRQVLRGPIPALPLTAAQEILVIRPDTLGDMVMMGPFLRALRTAAPRAKITLLVRNECLALFEHCPYIEKVHSLAFNKSQAYFESFPDAWRLRKLLPDAGFDLVMLPRRGPDWCNAEFVGHLLAGRGALMVHREKTVRSSTAVSTPRWIPCQIFSNSHIEHEVLHNLRFLGWCGAAGEDDARLEIWPSAADRTAARDWLAARFPRGKRLVVMHPSGGRSPLKQWPVENFREVLRLLVLETDDDFLIMGGDDESWITREFTGLASARIHISIGELSLPQLGAVLEAAGLFIGGDSGPMHLAAAAGTRVLGIFGPTSLVRFHPFGGRCKVATLNYHCSPDVLKTYEDRCAVCRFDHPLCLWELKPDMVVETVHLML